MGAKKKKPSKASSSASNSKRKSKVFSVSVSPDELVLVDGRVAAIRRKTGIKFSRNEFMRKAALAADAYFRALEADASAVPDFQELFTRID